MSVDTCRKVLIGSFGVNKKELLGKSRSFCITCLHLVTFSSLLRYKQNILFLDCAREVPRFSTILYAYTVPSLNSVSLLTPPNISNKYCSLVQYIHLPIQEFCTTHIFRDENLTTNLVASHNVYYFPVIQVCEFFVSLHPCIFVTFSTHEYVATRCYS